MDDNDEGAFRRLQLRIRTLTTLLSELAPPDFVHDRMETMTMTRAATFTMLCNNVALLLNTSLSSDAIAVGPAAYTVPLGLALVGIVDHDKELPTSEIFQARQSASGGDNESYIQSILNAFHPSGTEDRFATIMPLMLAHCHHKIAQSLSFSDTIFGRPLERVLAECQPNGTETWESYVSIPESISHLMADIPHRSSRAPGSRDYKLAYDTILQWTSVLSTQYAHLRDAFLEREGSDILNGRCLYFFLTSVMCSEPVLNTIFSRTDFLDRLMLAYTPPPSTLFAELGRAAAILDPCHADRPLRRKHHRL
ncbi:hypothetical protein BDZ89DRAFT_224798 [Hymenopellis radicata]|nr:hypothetical protein BDZ89DRAFT_224798 [Hymenopellis radicata]